MDYLRLLTNLEQKGKMKGVNFEGSFNLSHILFADDIVLFSEDNDEDISNLRYIIQTFEFASGLNFNLNKNLLSPLQMWTQT